MKISATTDKKIDFIPFELTIRIESKVEADKMFAIFNFSPVSDLIDDDNAQNIRTLIANNHKEAWSNDGQKQFFDLEELCREEYGTY